MRDTPWGKPQRVDRLAEGIDFYTTNNHGGVHLDRVRNAKMPYYMRKHANGGWYEEDNVWAFVALVYPDAFSPGTVIKARHIVMNYYPDEFHMYTGKRVDPADSCVLRGRVQAAMAYNVPVERGLNLAQ